MELPASLSFQNGTVCATAICQFYGKKIRAQNWCSCAGGAVKFTASSASALLSWLSGRSPPRPHIVTEINMWSLLQCEGNIKVKAVIHRKTKRVEVHLDPCGFDVVWAGGRHAQIPVILNSKTVPPHRLIVADTHTPIVPLLPLGAVVLLLPSGDVTSLQDAHSVYSALDSVCQTPSCTRQLLQFCRFGRESSLGVIKDRVQRALFYGPRCVE